MPDEDLHDKSLENDQKILGRHKWRGKFSRSERRSTLQDASQGHEIEDFLYGPRSGSLSAGNSGIDGPRLDTSVAKSSLGVQPLPESQVKRKLPRKPGLRVKFSDGLPEIIGEGGDEAQLPPLSIISLREQITQRPRKNFEGNKAQDQDEKFLPLEAARNESAEAVEAPLNPCILQRRSTGLQDLVREQEDTADDRLQHRVQNPPCEVYSDSGQESPQNPGIPLEHVHRERLNLIPSSNTGARLYLTKNDSEMTSSSDSLESTNRSVSHQELPDVTSSSEDCSTLIPSPKLATRHMHSCPAPTSHDLPELIDENRSLLPKADSRIYKESSAPAIGPRDQTLRTRVQDKGDDALHEFAIRVQAHGSVFLLGLSADTEIDLERCVRVSIWWFFKGRERLEASVRGASQHVQSEKQLPPDIWRELKQAYLDLSKSWWLVSEFIPKKHPEVNELGQEDTNSMAALVNSLNDVKTAELIQAYIMVIGKLRALAASMKKNERLPPASFEIQGLNIRIFEKTPALEPDIQAHLSVSYPKITTDNDDSNARYFFPMPLGDTDRHFNYGRMFVKVFLPPVAGQDEVCIICLLSILRRRTSQDITVAIAGQDRHLNLIIQPNPQNGLAWQDVRWRSQYHTMQVRLKSGYGLDVHFTPSDFKRLWGIRDYTRIVYNTFNGTESDNLVFEKTLGSFQLFNAGKDTHRFPQEPIAGCYLRLFEKRSVISAGTGERKVHNGHRLIIITPPQVKALSFVSQDLGIQVPIIFSYLRGESGASALLLKTSKSSRDTSMILSYQKSEDRELFYAVLGGMNISSEEICSTNLALKSLKISTQQSIGDVQDDNDGEISNLHWQHLQVIRPNPNRSANGISQTVLPAQLRLRAECDSGCLVDRINLGK